MNWAAPITVPQAHRILYGRSGHRTWAEMHPQLFSPSWCALHSGRRQGRCYTHLPLHLSLGVKVLYFKSKQPPESNRQRVACETCLWPGAFPNSQASDCCSLLSPTQTRFSRSIPSSTVERWMGKALSSCLAVLPPVLCQQPCFAALWQLRERKWDTTSEAGYLKGT